MKTLFNYTSLLFFWPYHHPVGDGGIEDDVDLVFETWCAPNLEIEVTRVYDGDTFMYMDSDGVEQKIRMLGVAAPEVASDGEPAECYGDAAGAFAWFF